MDDISPSRPWRRAVADSEARSHGSARFGVLSFTRRSYPNLILLSGAVRPPSDPSFLPQECPKRLDIRVML